MFGDTVLDIIVEKIKRSVWFTCLMDETQDIPTLEQVCICMRYIDDSELSVWEDFLHLHDIIGTTAVELYEILTKTINTLGERIAEVRSTMEPQMFLVMFLVCRHQLGVIIQKPCIPTALAILLICC